MRKVWVTHSYENCFEMEVADDATNEEIRQQAIDEDELLGGDWSTTFEEIEDE